MQLEYESKDRVLYGKRHQINEYLSLRDALEEIEFLGAHFWYANFGHPDAYGKLPRFRYRGPEGDFVSWKERAGFSASQEVMPLFFAFSYAKAISSMQPESVGSPSFFTRLTSPSSGQATNYFLLRSPKSLSLPLRGSVR